MGDNACVRHHCARVSACYGEEPSLVEVAQERATTTSYLWPLRTSLFPQRLRSRIADHRRFFTNFVHAIQDKKKLVYVQPCEFVPPISSSSARIPFSSRIIKFRRYRYGPFFPFLEIFTLERLVSLLNVRLLIHCT